MKEYQTFLAACLLAGLSSLAGADDRRDVRLDGQPNFRDLGGYTTSDGRTVKSGLVFRSGELPRLTDDDVAKLQKLGIKTLGNFLTDEEIHARGKDRLPDRVAIRKLPIAGGDAAGGGLAGAILKARQTADFSEVPVELNPDIHRLLETLRDALLED